MGYFGRITDKGGVEVMPVDDEDDGSMVWFNFNDKIYIMDETYNPKKFKMQNYLTKKQKALRLQSHLKQRLKRIRWLLETWNLQSAAQFVTWGMAWVRQAQRRRCSTGLWKQTEKQWGDKHLKLHNGSMRLRWFKQKLYQQLCVNLQLMRGNCMRQHTCHIDNGVDTVLQQIPRGRSEVETYSTSGFWSRRMWRRSNGRVWTKTCMADVVSKKSVNVIGESLANFLGDLDYSEAIEICCDNEPVLAAWVKLTKDIRTRNELETVVTCGKAYDKGRTSAA